MAFQVGKRPQSVRFLVYYSTKKSCRNVNAGTTDCSQLEREILEWNIPEEVLAVLLKDRTTSHMLDRNGGMV